ncbi:MAG: polysaccharide biosynthesis C-terminal domain-containing protein, partial [Raoultibacter sp.]
IYASVAAPALIIQMGAVYLYGPLLDVFARQFFEGTRRQFKLLLIKTIAGIAGVAIVCAIILEFIGPWALELLFGEGIAPYVFLLQPILLSTVMTAYLWFFGDLLIALRDFKAYFIGNVVAFLVVIPLSFLCVNQWEMNGVSFAGAAACFVGVLILFFFLVRRLRTSPDEILSDDSAHEQFDPEQRIEGLEDGVQR